MKSDKWENFLFMFSVIVFLDRILKTFLENACISVFCIKRAANSGAAFGVLEGQTLFFIMVSIMVFFLIFYFWRIKEIRMPLTLVAAGTFGNLLDRIMHGKIIDVFSIAGSSSFNLADICNLAGAVMLVIYLIRNKKE
jgi:signal peptidase II